MKFPIQSLNYLYLAAIILQTVLICSCKKSTDDDRFPTPRISTTQGDKIPDDISREIYFDKVYGMLLGSAIGDAMGAPTEMWHRDQIVSQWGYVDRPEPVIREGSPEGPWAVNLPPGGTTDDTRWKYLITHFMTGQNLSNLQRKDFSQYIVQLYLDEQKDINQEKSFSPENIETESLHMTWLQEWAKVAQTYLDDDIDAFQDATNKFYGGEMACAGLLYTPGIGVYYPGQPNKAYEQSFKLSLFDIGYARDISGLTAAYVAQAMKPGISSSEIGEVSRTVDPKNYFRSRLVGRISYRIFQDARQIAFDAKSLEETKVDPELKLPPDYPYSKLYYSQVQHAYSSLDQKLQDIPFHAGEIHLINLTAIEFSNGDFKKAIEFVVNFGRDNDTVAAVTGAILGAYTGASELPPDWVKIVESTNVKTLGIDIEKLATTITDQVFGLPQN